MHLAIHSVRRVCPIYGVKGEGGSYWRCIPEHEGAEIVSYQVTDFSGNTYSCGNPAELKKLGIVAEPQPRRQIGFVNQKDDEKLEVEMTSQKDCPTTESDATLD
jgi:hypothetical protein